MAAEKDPGGLGALTAQGEQVRASARWVLGAFAAAGASLIPGLGVAGIGSLEGWRAWVAATAVTVAVLAVIASITAIVRFLAPSSTSLDELAARERCGDRDSLVEYFSKSQTLFQGQATSLSHLQKRRTEARERVAQEQERAHAEPRIPKEGDTTPLARAESQLRAIEGTVASVESVASFQDLRQTFLRRRWIPVAAAWLVAASLAAFSVATQEPPRDTGDFEGKTLKRIDLSGTKLAEADLSGTTFKDSDLLSADLDEADTDGARFIRTRCPDGTRTSGERQTCDGHLDVRPIDFPILEQTTSVPRW